MTRRSGSETRIRDIAFATRWSKEEFARLDEIATYSGCSRGEVLRRLVRHNHRNIIPSRELVTEVLRLGVNINQLARAANGGRHIRRNALEQLYAEILAVLIEMRS